MSLVKSLQRTEVITAGYIRNVQELLPFHDNAYYIIPSDMNKVILSYIYNYFMNIGVHEWKIDDVTLVQRMLTAKCGDKFESDPFELVRLKWKFEIYPNGFTEETEGYLIIHLILLSLPSIVDTISIGRVFRVNENDSGAPYLSDISLNEYEYWGKKCPLQELINLNCKSITIKAYINIFKISLKEKISNYSLDQVKCQNKPDIKSKHHFESYFDEKETIKFKNTVGVKCFCSSLYDDIFALMCYPNGAFVDHAGWIEVALGLVSLPINVKKLKIKYTLKLKESNHEWFSTQYFEIGHSGWLVPQWININNIKQYKTLTFSVDIEILQMIGYAQDNHLEISDEIQIANILSHHSINQQNVNKT